MSDYRIHSTNDEDVLSLSSDEKMDTGSESLKSNTPNSILSSDFEDKDANDEKNQPTNVLRLGGPELKKELSDSLTTKMANLQLDSPVIIKNYGVSPPKVSTLVQTNNHPLMGLSSPDGVYPDLIPKKGKEDDKELSLSSIEDEKPNNANGYEFYPEQNTSKNNLYFSDHFVTADSKILQSIDSPPDVTKIQEKMERRKIVPKLVDPKITGSLTPTSILNCSADSNKEYSAIINKKFHKLNSHSTPHCSGEFVLPKHIDLNSRSVAEWCDSPSYLRSTPNFDLPIELSTNISTHKGQESPNGLSSSTQEDKSAYQALLDPYTGSVALRPIAPKSPVRLRRIQLPPEDQDCSLDSLSECSMESEEEPPEPEEEPPEPVPLAPKSRESDEDDTKRSTNTISETSEPIPEYSAAEEFHDERSWLTVPRPEGNVKCDMKVIEPYKRVISHGGYDASGAAIIVFSAVHLPDTARQDYTYVMDHLFLYVIWSLERLITDDYILVYLHGSAERRKLPTFHWLHECYKLIDRRLRKSLKHLYLVHPTFWLRSFVLITKPFVSSKFFRKLSYIRSLKDLYDQVPVEPNAIPELVKIFDERR